MKIKTTTNLSGINYTFSRNTEYDVEPNLAQSLINSGHAVAVGPFEKPAFPADFPHRERLYHRGYKTPQQVIDNLSAIAKIKGMSTTSVEEIETYLRDNAPAPIPTLPKDLPHAATLIEQGITSIDQLNNTPAASISFLSAEEIAEINDYLTPSDNEVSEELSAPVSEETAPVQEVSAPLAEPAKPVIAKPASKRTRNKK